MEKKNQARLVYTGVDSIDEDIDDFLEANLLSGMINSDGIVKIGDYLFNINIQTNKCYALHTSFLSGRDSAYYYGLLLNENYNNSYVFDFTTDDDVLDILEDAGFPKTKPYQGWCGTAARRCGDGSAAKRKDSGTDSWPQYDKNTQDFVKVKLVYQKGGIYFALKTKLEMGNLNNPWQGLQANYSWKYKPKCKDERIQNPTTYNSSNSNNTYVKYAYEASRGLAKYSMSYQWNILGHNPTSNSILSTRTYHIESGY